MRRCRYASRTTGCSFTRRLKHRHDREGGSDDDEWWWWWWAYGGGGGGVGGGGGNSDGFGS